MSNSKYVYFCLDCDEIIEQKHKDPQHPQVVQEVTHHSVQVWTKEGWTHEREAQAHLDSQDHKYTLGLLRESGFIREGEYWPRTGGSQ